MTYVVTLDERRAMGVVRFHGGCTLQDHCNARDAIAELVRTHSVRRVLVDLSDSVFPDISTIEQYSFTESLARSFVPGTRVAIVTPRSSDFRFRFPADVAFNRGIPLPAFPEGSQADARLFEPQELTQEAETEPRLGS